MSKRDNDFPSKYEKDYTFFYPLKRSRNGEKNLYVVDTMVKVSGTLSIITDIVLVVFYKISNLSPQRRMILEG